MCVPYIICTIAHTGRMRNHRELLSTGTLFNLFNVCKLVCLLLRSLLCCLEHVLVSQPLSLRSKCSLFTLALLCLSLFYLLLFLMSPRFPTHSSSLCVQNIQVVFSLWTALVFCLCLRWPVLPQFVFIAVKCLLYLHNPS